MLLTNTRALKEDRSARGIAGLADRVPVRGIHYQYAIEYRRATSIHSPSRNALAGVVYRNRIV